MGGSQKAKLALINTKLDAPTLKKKSHRFRQCVCLCAPRFPQLRRRMGDILHFLRKSLVFDGSNCVRYDSNSGWVEVTGGKAITVRLGGWYTRFLQVACVRLWRGESSYASTVSIQPVSQPASQPANDPGWKRQQITCQYGHTTLSSWSCAHWSIGYRTIMKGNLLAGCFGPCHLICVLSLAPSADGWYRLGVLPQHLQVAFVNLRSSYLWPTYLVWLTH